ncbi:MAG: hypothetical protein HYX92_10730 [Chloroflexi bacterium]|nr:hypothetical protein [Chloroflexota bacterium]
MHAKKWFLVASFLTVLGLLLTSCAPAAAPAPTVPAKAVVEPTKPAAAATPSKPQATAPAATPKPAGEQPRYGGVLNVASTTDPPSLDIQQETNYQVHLTMEVDYSGLLQYDPLQNDKMIGDLAEKWDLAPDGASYTFNLHKGVKWHDGSALTSEDVKFSLDRMRNPPTGVRSPMQPLLAAIKEIQTPDKDTVKIILNHPSPSIIAFLAIGQMVMYSKAAIESKGDMKKTAVGTGPYKFKAYNVGIDIQHVKNPDYFVKGRPYLDAINFYMIKDRGTRAAAFRTKKIHLGTGWSGPTVAEAENLKKNFPEAIVQAYPSLVNHEVRPMTTKGPTADQRVRKAIYLAIDRQAAVKVVGQGEAWIGGPLPPYGPFGIPEADLLKLPGFRQPKDLDIAEAKRLLAEAGHPNGFKTEILGRPDADAEFAVFFKDQMAKIGIDGTVKLVDTALRNQLYAQRNFEITVITYGLKTLDPDDISRYFLKGAPQNYNDFYDEQVQKLFEQETRTIDFNERKKIVMELQNRLLDIGGSIIGLWQAQRASYWPDLKNYKPGISVYNLNKYQDVWLAK